MQAALLVPYIIIRSWEEEQPYRPSAAAQSLSGSAVSALVVMSYVFLAE